MRAGLLERTRAFFARRGVLEVETPTLAPAVIVERHIDPIPARCHPDGPGGSRTQPLYLLSSPEAHMKRLLAAGSGPIYQITRSFRDGERGTMHNPEFTILEWYRPGWDSQRLMDEVSELLEETLGASAAARISYRELFRESLGIDPFSCAAGELERAAADAGLDLPRGADRGDRDLWLDLLLGGRLQGELGRDRPTFLHDYPASQAALARVRREDYGDVAERFELFHRGIELCNGYRELTDPEEQRHRLDEAKRQRRADGRAPLPVDERFLEALEAGLPEGSGVALGLDRLVMLACGARTIDEVIAFPFGRA